MAGELEVEFRWSRRPGRGKKRKGVKARPRCPLLGRPVCIPLGRGKEGGERRGRTGATSRPNVRLLFSVFTSAAGGEKKKRGKGRKKGKKKTRAFGLGLFPGEEEEGYERVVITL